MNDDKKHTTINLILWILLACLMGFLGGEFFMVMAKENYNYMIDHPEHYNSGMIPKDSQKWK